MAERTTRRISCPFFGQHVEATLQHQRRPQKKGAGQLRFVFARRAADFPFQFAFSLQFAGDQQIVGARRAGRLRPPAGANDRRLFGQGADRVFDDEDLFAVAAHRAVGWIVPDALLDELRQLHLARPIAADR